MEVIVKENTWLTRGMMDFGWGNGYVIIPKGHKLHGEHYDNIDIDIHGGLTYSDELTPERLEKMFPDVDKKHEGAWIVGFDTAHYMDTLENCSEHYVTKETENLKQQLLQYDK